VVSRLRCALLVVMGLLVAGLVSATVITGASAAGHHAPRALVQSQAGAVSDPGLTGANRRAAVSDAATLLGYVVAPSGATVISQGTAIGWRDGHVITAAMASAVAYRSWTVAEDPASVLADVQAQLPARIKDPQHRVSRPHVQRIGDPVLAIGHGSPGQSAARAPGHRAP
jgi:hypothetical protein